MKIKPGVCLIGLRPQVGLAIEIAGEVYRAQGYDCVVTSVSEGDHGRKSLHYSGCAADLRTRHLAEHDRKIVAQLVHEALGAEFDVVLEETHLHIEWDPKR